MSDLKFAVRTLLRRPGFSFIAVLTLALGIGLNTAVFTLVSGVLLRPLPFRASEQLVRIWEGNPERGALQSPISYPDFVDIAGQATSFERVMAFAAFRMGGAIRTGVSDPEEIPTSFVSGDFFQTLGAEPILGRSFTPVEDRVGDDAVVVLSHGYWQRAFGGDPGVLNEVMTLDDVPTRVIGVMPPDFRYPLQNSEIWVPLSWISEEEVPHIRQVQWLSLVGRLKEGVAIEEARSELDTILGRLAAAYPEQKSGWTQATVQPIGDSIVGDVRTSLLILLGAVGFVMLIACANVANLLLARAAGRDREIAVRTALGAGRGRLVKQMMAETMLLAAAGGVAGIVLATWAAPLLVRLAPSELPRTAEIALDQRVLLFALAVSLLTGLVFGLLPAIRHAGAGLHDRLREGGRTGTDSGARKRTRQGLVIVQVSLAIVLVTGAGLMVRSLGRLADVEMGFAPENLLTFHVSLPESRYDGEGFVNFMRSAQEELEALPGVRSAAAIKELPAIGTGEGIPVFIEGQPRPEPGTEPYVGANMITPGYFRTMGIPLLAGRDFTLDDNVELGRIVVIVNDAFARRFWPSESAVGKHLVGIGQPVEVIGVVGDVRQAELSLEPEPAAYLTEYQITRSVMYFVVRTAAEPLTMVASVREAIRRLDPDQPLTQIASMEQVVGNSIAQPRSVAALLGLFATLAGCLAAIGLYGVLSYAVARRTRELGIRQALGADSRAVLGLVIREGMTLVAIGIVAGLAGAVATSRALAGMLYEIHPLDPVALALAIGLLAAVGLAACLVPARRALRVDPSEALRYE